MDYVVEDNEEGESKMGVEAREGGNGVEQEGDNKRTGVEAREGGWACKQKGEQEVQADVHKEKEDPERGMGGARGGAN